jgi:hypothetical protein
MVNPASLITKRTMFAAFSGSRAMAMIKCRECGRDVSDEATACPNCGCPVKAAGVEPPPLIQQGPTVAAPPDTTTDHVPKTATYHAERPPLRLRPVGILLGLCLAGIGVWLALVYIPEHDVSRLEVDPHKIGEMIDAAGTEYLHPDDIRLLRTASIILIVLGTAQLVLGSAKRSGALRYCKNCGIRVVARRKWFVWRCERCNQRA